VIEDERGDQMKGQQAFEFKEPTESELAAWRELIGRLPWKECRPGYADQVGQHSYVITNRTCTYEEWREMANMIRRYGRKEYYPPSKCYFVYFFIDGFRYWSMRGCINRARFADTDAFLAKFAIRTEPDSSGLPSSRGPSDDQIQNAAHGASSGA
jgi:hypothetical protein